MEPFERILFPVDFSDHCTQASCWVAETARSLGSELILLHAFEGYDSLELGVGSRFCEDDVSQELLNQRQRRLRDFGKSCFEGINVHRIVKCGNAAECIVACAKEHGVSLILMPTRGEGRFRRLLAGSVTLKVLHDAACAVWTTAHAEMLPPRPPVQIRKILCAVDFSPESHRVVSVAAKLASVYGASVCLSHTISTAKETLRQDSIRQLNLLVDQATSEMANVEAGARPSFETRVAVGHITDSIRSLALQLPADLVVAGHGRTQHHFGEFWSHLGSIIHESPCPVLSVLGQNS